MQRLRLFVLAFSTIVMCACHWTERSGTCVPITSATRVMVQSLPPGTANADHVIQDPSRVHDLIAFANARRKVSQPSLYAMPAPQVISLFYSGGNSVGAIGAGPNFFFVSCSHWKGVRDATPAEIGEFQRLIGSSDEKRTHR